MPGQSFPKIQMGPGPIDSGHGDSGLNWSYTKAADLRPSPGTQDAKFQETPPGLGLHSAPGFVSPRARFQIPEVGEMEACTYPSPQKGQTPLIKWARNHGSQGV